MPRKRDFDPCLNTVKDPRFGLLESEAVDLVETLRKQQRAIRDKGGPDYTVQFRRVVEDMTNAQKFEVKQRRLQRKLQILKNRRMEDR